MGLRMLLLLHALIPCLGAYNILPSSSVLLHINIVSHSLCCCIYIYTTLVSLLFGTVIPTSFNILMEMFLLPLYICTVHTVMLYVLLILRVRKLKACMHGFHSPARYQC